MVGERGQTMDKTLIGIHGKPRSGKDTIADHLRDKYKLLRYGPSVPVKRVAAVMFDVPEAVFSDDKLKDTIDPFWNITYRQMAQKVGKECSRDLFGEDFWLRHVERALQTMDHPGIVLADLRYANEASWVRQQGGLVLFVKRDQRGFVSNEGHPAEQGLSDDLADVIVSNNGTIEELYEKVDLIVSPFLSK